MSQTELEELEVELDDSVRDAVILGILTQMKFETRDSNRVMNAIVQALEHTRPVRLV